EARVVFGPGDGLGEFGGEAAADGRDVDADLLEHFSDHLPANAAATGFAARLSALPRDVGEGGVGAGLALDRLKRGGDAVAQRLEPVARGLLFGIEGQHAQAPSPAAAGQSR